MYPSPSTLGNGLVHDTRYLLGNNTDSVTILTADLDDGVPWDLGDHQTMLAVGFRPAQIHAEISMASILTVTNVTIEDDSIYISDDDANYLYRVETYIFESKTDEKNKSSFGPVSDGFRPISIDVVNIPTENRDAFGFTVAWVYDGKSVDWELITPRETSEFNTDIATLAGQGYRPISMSSRRRSGTNTSDFAAIMVDDDLPATDWQATLNVGVEEIEDETQDAWDEGFYPVSGWTRNDSGVDPKFNFIWALRPPPAAPDGFAIAARIELEASEFAANGEDADQRASGKHLLSADWYEQDNDVRYAGLWAIYPPYHRWTGTETPDAMDPDFDDYTDRWVPFHDQVLTVMDRVGTASQDEFFRPSATLHIYEGDDLVLNRAYTYAPATYPDTELDAVFKLASVSKSLTAAAIVQAFDDQSLPLSTTFASAVGWTGTSYCGGSPPLFPVGLASVTIDQMLQHQAGFQDGGLPAYYEHADIITGLIGVSLPNADGDLPIDTEELLFYLGESNALCAGMPAAWRSDWVSEGEILFGMYSNLGYSLLGEALSQTASVSYADYIETELLDPLVLGLVADPDHRYFLPGPTLASLRSYLVNIDHPYRIADTWDQNPLFGTDPPPVVPQNGDHPVWRESANPDPDAPDFVERAHHAGEYSGGGAPLPAGGWFGNGADLGELLRDLAQTGTLMSTSVADRLWDPDITIVANPLSPCWEYGRGFYVRGNWIAMAGGGDGSTAIAMHNWQQDFTVVMLTNMWGNAFDEFANPILTAIGSTEFACVDAGRFPEDECGVGCNP